MYDRFMAQTEAAGLGERRASLLAPLSGRVLEIGGGTGVNLPLYPATWQDRLDPIWLRIGHGCHPNRDTLSAIAAAGFSTDGVEHGSLPKAAKLVKPMISGVASAEVTVK
jgi:hypothetical protein